MATKIKWENADFKWEKAPTDDTQPRYTWDEVLLVEEVASSDSALRAVEALEPEKKKRFIRLICKVKALKHIRVKKQFEKI